VIGSAEVILIINAGISVFFKVFPTNSQPVTATLILFTISVRTAGSEIS